VLPPQLMMIFNHATQCTSSAATFSLIVSIGGERGIALVDSGSSHTFMDYTFASKLSCEITSIKSHRVKVAGGGHLNTSAAIHRTDYSIQKEQFTNAFILLELKGYDIILGCDWIKHHSPIGLDLREKSRLLTIHKEGKSIVTFIDFTPLRTATLISVSQLEKMCRTQTVGYIIQINLIQNSYQIPPQVPPPPHHCFDTVGI
jgi:hypothetical protein